ncbi:MAG: NAD-dependent epimerase/dehydratase family protein, partial [Stackebrandtia sp.]
PWSRYRRVVVDATARLLEAADAGGVKRFVYVSSEAVLQAGAPLLDVDETAPPPRSPSSRYGRAKLAAERAVLGYEGPIERVILRPPFIWGDGNEVTARFASLAEAGKLPLIDGGASSFEHIHVDNAAAAVIAALTGGRDRDVYFITNGEPMPVAEFLAGILGAYDAPAPRRSLPSRLLRPVASVLQGVWAGLRLPGAPPLTPFEVEFFSLPRRFHIDAARRDLGYQPAVSFADGVDRLARAVKAK